MDDLLVIRAILLGLGLAAIATAADADDRAEICVRGHSQTLRLPDQEYYALRDAAFARAGIPVSMQCNKHNPPPGCYILDHIVPLELCRAADNCNRLDNIQIQTWSAADAKDRIEDEERWRYCHGEETREQAIANPVFKRSVP
jgi:hypothetical protein